jgi:hypothetical protein
MNLFFKQKYTQYNIFNKYIKKLFTEVKNIESIKNTIQITDNCSKVRIIYYKI